MCPDPNEPFNHDAFDAIDTIADMGIRPVTSTNDISASQAGDLALIAAMINTSRSIDQPDMMLPPATEQAAYDEHQRRSRDASDAVMASMERRILPLLTATRCEPADYIDRDVVTAMLAQRSGMSPAMLERNASIRVNPIYSDDGPTAPAKRKSPSEFFDEPSTDPDVILEAVKAFPLRPDGVLMAYASGPSPSRLEWYARLLRINRTLQPMFRVVHPLSAHIATRHHGWDFSAHPAACITIEAYCVRLEMLAARMREVFTHNRTRGVNRPWTLTEAMNAGQGAATSIPLCFSELLGVLSCGDQYFGIHRSFMKWIEMYLETASPNDTTKPAVVQRENVVKAFAFPFREREMARFATEYYERVPWHNDLVSIEDHFVHIDPSDPGKLRYTENEAKGDRHIYISTRPGRYLTKYYPSLSNDDVREWQAKVDRANTVKFAETSEECVEVYTNGPNSCMSHGVDDFQGHCHPCMVYGGKADVTVAYLEKPNGKGYSARAIVWPEKKLFGRMYGDEHRLKVRLEAAGYTSDELSGFYVNLIPDQKDRKNRIIMPYFDCGGGAKIDGDRVFVSRDVHELEIHNTDGVAYIGHAVRCTNCEERAAEDDMVTDAEGDVYCRSCADDQLYHCDRLDIYTTDALTEVNMRRGRNGQYSYYSEWWCQRALDLYAYFCQRTDEYYDEDTCPSVAMENGDTWSCRAFATEGAVGHDGKNYPDDELPPDPACDLLAAAKATYKVSP